MKVLSDYKIPDNYVVKCENVDDFLKKIYPSSGMGNSVGRRSVFRGQHRRRILICLLSCLLASALCYGQVIVENPKHPANPEAGRTVKLIEKMRIRDDGKEIVFKYPDQLQVGDDGGIFFACWPEYLKYDAQGRFIFGIVK
jgi:hypothetical protein